MSNLLVCLLTIATAVHSVFGCCWHHARALEGNKPSKQLATGHCSCQLHAHSHADVSTLRHGSARDRVDAEQETTASIPSDQPRRDHPCHNSKCVSVLAEKTPDPGRADRLPSVGDVPLVTEQTAEVLALTSSGEPLLDFQTARPIRAHLFLRVLLI
jgi:hypothetical protein